MLALAATSVASATASATAGAGQAIQGVIATAIPSIIASVLPSGITTTQPVTSVTLQVPVALEVASALAGGLAGALAAVRLRFDLIGILTLAVVSGLGGGIVRDVLLQKYGVYALQNPRLLIATLVAGIIGFFFFSLAERLKWTLFVVDALALGLFAALGSDKALLAGLTMVPAILLGTITAVGGGMIRDVLTGEVPMVLRPGSFYATAAVAGTVLYVALVSWLNVVKPVAIIACVVMVVGLRVLSYVFGWQSPTATDLTPLVAAAPRRVIRAGGRLVGRGKRGGPAKTDEPSSGPPADDSADPPSSKDDDGAARADGEDGR